MTSGSAPRPGPTLSWCPCSSPILPRPRLLLPAALTSQGALRRSTARTRQCPLPSARPWRQQTCHPGQGLQAVALEQEAHAAPAVAPPLPSTGERTPWSDAAFLERASWQQLGGVLRKLRVQGELSRQQEALACELVAELDLSQLAPDQLAAALLVVLARSEGRARSMTEACRAVRRACGLGRYSLLLCGVLRQLEGVWQDSARWQQLLGPPVSSSTLTAQQVQHVLGRLAAKGPPELAALATAAARAAQAVVPDGKETPGNLAGGLLVLVSRCQGSDGGPPLATTAATRAIHSVGAEASQSGVAHAIKRLEGCRQALGLSPAPVDGQPQQRLEQLGALLGRMEAEGELPAADVPLLLQLARGLPRVGWPASATAAALVVVLGWARGAAVKQGAAAAAVRRAGGEMHGGISFHVKLLAKHWQASVEWQALLGPPKDQVAVGRERLAELLRRLSEQGALRQRQLSLALELAGELQPGVLGPPHLTGGLAGALLVLLAAASGERLSKKRAEGLVHAAGGEASHSGISHNLARLREHWEQSAAWRAALGQPPAAAAWEMRPAPLQQLLQRLAESGQLDPGLAPAVDQMAGRLVLPPTAHGNFVAAVLVAVAATAAAEQQGQRQRQSRRGRQLTIQQAVAAVKSAGGSASLGRAGAMLRRLLASWEAGDRECQALLGTHGPPGSSDTLPQLEELLRTLCFAGALAPGQLSTALQLAGSLAVRARQVWRAGSMAGGLLVVLAAAEGRHLRPAQAAELVRGAAGVEAAAADVFRHKTSAWKLWQSSKDWQALLGGPPLPHPPSRTTVSGLLRALASRGALPSSQLQPALALARGLRVPQNQAAAVAGALAVGWAAATGRAPSVEGVVAALLEAGGSAAAADVRSQLARLEERWGPPSAWAAALNRPHAAAQQQCWRTLAMLLTQLEATGHLRPGQAAKGVYLAQMLKVWTGHGPSQKPGNVAGALALLLARAPGGRGPLTCTQAVAAVRAAGAAAFGSSVTKWHSKCMRLWREAPEWQEVLGTPPQVSCVGRAPACQQPSIAS